MTTNAHTYMYTLEYVTSLSAPVGRLTAVKPRLDGRRTTPANHAGGTQQRLDLGKSKYFNYACRNPCLE